MKTIPWIEKHRVTLSCTAVFTALAAFAWVWTDRDSQGGSSGNNKTSGMETDGGRGSRTKRPRPEPEGLSGKPAGRDRFATPHMKGKETRLTPGRTQEDLDEIVGWTLRPYERLFNQRERFSTLDKNGLLSEDAIRVAGLQDQEVSACREIFARHRQQMHALIKANVVPDYTDADDPTVEKMFYIRAFPMEGSERFEAFFRELGDALGENKRNAVLGGFSVRGAISYGNRNAHVKIYAADPSGSTGRTVQIEYYNALNYELTGVAGMPIEAFRTTFGAIDGLQ